MKYIIENDTPLLLENELPSRVTLGAGTHDLEGATQTGKYIQFTLDGDVYLLEGKLPTKK